MLLLVIVGGSLYLVAAEMLHRISSLCLKFLKTNGPRLHHGFSLNQCASSDCRSVFSIWSPVWFARGQANLTLSFEKTFTSSKRSSPSSNKILLAFGVAGLMKFLGLADQNEDSELIQIIKKAEIALLVSAVRPKMGSHSY